MEIKALRSLNFQLQKQHIKRKSEFEIEEELFVIRLLGIISSVDLRTDGFVPEIKPRNLKLDQRG